MFIPVPNNHTINLRIPITAPDRFVYKRRRFDDHRRMRYINVVFLVRSSSLLHAESESYRFDVTYDVSFIILQARDNFQKKLLIVELSWMNDDSQQEVLLQVIYIF